MKRILLLLLPMACAIQAFAYDIHDFIKTCREMPNASYVQLEGERLKETLNSVASSRTLLLSPKGETNQNPDSLFSDVKKIDSVVFMDFDTFNNVAKKEAIEDNGSLFMEIKAAAGNIDGYEEYVYQSLILSASDVDDADFAEMTSKLTEEQKEEFNEILKNNFRIAIFGKRTSEKEFKDPIFIISFIGFTDVMVLDGIVPITDIDSWTNSIKF